jgi:hypothetical protein
VGDGSPGQAVTYLDAAVLEALKGEYNRLQAVIVEQKAEHVRGLKISASASYAVKSAEEQLVALKSMLSWQAPPLRQK